MRFAVQDYNTIFDMNELMTNIRYDNGCMIWKGAYTSNLKNKQAIHVIRFDGELISCKVLDIISAVLMDGFVKSKNRKCKCKICVNPAHYLKRG